MTVTQAIVLCGGRGERLRPITDTVPKPMVSVCGRPFVSYLIECLANNGILDIVLSVGYLKDKFEDWSIGSNVRLVDCDPLSVNRSVLMVPYLKDKFIVANGDIFPIMKWKEFMKCSNGRGLVAVKSSPEFKDVGICVVNRKDVELGLVDCGNVRGMIPVYDNFMTSGNLHIGTPDGLKLAEDTMSWWWRK